MLEFITENNVIIVVGLYCVGLMVKQTPKMPNWLIPYLITGLGVVVSMLFNGMTIESAWQGVLCASVAVFGNELIKQWQNGGAL